MEYIRIERTHEGRAGKIIIDRTDKMNALTVEMRQAYGRVVGELSDDPEVRVVDVQGAGDKALSAGGDVAQFLKLAPHDLVAEEIDRHCREQADFSGFKRPRRVIFVKRIPRTASGKILRRMLRAV